MNWLLVALLMLDPTGEIRPSLFSKQHTTKQQCELAGKELGKEYKHAGGRYFYYCIKIKPFEGKGGLG